MSQNHQNQDMNKPDSSASTTLPQQLKEGAAGLFYISETDAPFELVQLPHVQDSALLPAALMELQDTAEGTKVETQTLPSFFRNMTTADPDAEGGEDDTARRFRDLQELMEQNLEEVKVYRIGSRRIHAFILGRTAAGDFAGLRTFLVET